MPKNIYKLKDGTLVPGVTTIINQLDKPALIQWAWKLGKEGKDWKTERDSAGDIGTLVHEIIMEFLSGGQFPDSMPSPIDKCIDNFEGWYEKEIGFCEPKMIIEQPLVSEKYGFGGQPDIFIADGNRLIDIKTGGKWVYPEWWIQLAGYSILLQEAGYKVKSYQILWLPKDGKFDCPIRTDLRKEKKKFKLLLEYYKLDHS